VWTDYLLDAQRAESSFQHRPPRFPVRQPSQIIRDYLTQTIVIVIRETELAAVPWKNGGGMTREFCRAPCDAPAFDWRLSLATIDRPGPFSLFEGYERILVLVRGAGIELDFGARGQARLDRVGQLVTFDGGSLTCGAPLDGSSTDLNLMVSRARAKTQSRVVRLANPEVISTAGWSDTLVCCLSGSVQIQNAAGHVAELHSADLARCVPTDGLLTCQLRSAAAADLFIAAVGGR
jgi:environmental stress-induced protein Ves